MSQAKKTGLGMFGVRFRKHRAEKIAQDIMYSKLSQEAPTPESNAKAIEHRRLQIAAEQGDLGPARDALAHHRISQQQFRSLLNTSRGQNLAELVRNFTYPEFTRVYEAATPEQKQMLEPIRRKKEAQARAKGQV